ncbi:MAG: hypothetical protein U0892_14015 [Pirellulales bacterium]
MPLDRFQRAWKNDAAQVKVSVDWERLSQKVRQSESSFRSLIYWRDVREIGVALTMIPIWISLGAALSLPWTWYLTIPMFVWSAGFMLAYRMRNGRMQSDAGEPLSFYAQVTLNQIEHQIWLLRNVFWWALLPFSLSIMAFFLQVGWESVKSWWGAVIIAGPGGTFVFYLYRWIYRLNQAAVREHLEPQRDKLRNLISSIESGLSTEGFDDLLNSVPSWSPSGGKDKCDASMPAWAENWNRIIPSWREVTIILAPTLIGAFCGWQFAVPDIGGMHFGPVFFQSVVAAVIPFEITFFTLWYRSSRRHRNQPLPSDETPRPKAPALFTIAMIIVISILAVAALVAYVQDQQSRQVQSRNENIPSTKSIW